MVLERTFATESFFCQKGGWGVYIWGTKSEMTNKLFILTFIPVIGSWLFSIIELIAIYKFSSFFFSLGIPVCRQTIDLPKGFKIVEHNINIRKTEGLFKFTTNNQVLFLSQKFWRIIFRSRTPFPIKAIGTITSDNKMIIVARLPLGSALSFLSFLMCFIVNIAVVSVHSGKYSNLLFILIPIAIIAISFSFDFFNQKERMKLMIRELQEIITELSV